MCVWCVFVCECVCLCVCGVHVCVVCICVCVCVCVYGVHVCVCGKCMCVYVWCMCVCVCGVHVCVCGVHVCVCGVCVCTVCPEVRLGGIMVSTALNGRHKESCFCGTINHLSSNSYPQCTCAEGYSSQFNISIPVCQSVCLYLFQDINTSIHVYITGYMPNFLIKAWQQASTCDEAVMPLNNTHWCQLHV